MLHQDQIAKPGTETRSSKFVSFEANENPPRRRRTRHSGPFKRRPDTPRWPLTRASDSETHLDTDDFMVRHERERAACERELRQGRKETHWMHHMFPQLYGLGSSEMSRKYALDGLGAARDFLKHPVLGKQLIKHTKIILEIAAAQQGKDNDTGIGDRMDGAVGLFGVVDAEKFHACLSLFSLLQLPDVDTDDCFDDALLEFFGGKLHSRTVAGLTKEPDGGSQDEDQ